MAIVLSFPLIGNWLVKLVWKVGNGTRMMQGEDPRVGCGESYVLRRNLVFSLRDRGIIFLSQVANPNSTTVLRQGWMTSDKLGFNVILKVRCGMII